MSGLATSHPPLLVDAAELAPFAAHAASLALLLPSPPVEATPWLLRLSPLPGTDDGEAAIGEGVTNGVCAEALASTAASAALFSPRGA